MKIEDLGSMHSLIRTRHISYYESYYDYCYKPPKENHDYIINRVSGKLHKMPFKSEYLNVIPANSLWNVTSKPLLESTSSYHDESNRYHHTKTILELDVLKHISGAGDALREIYKQPAGGSFSYSDLNTVAYNGQYLTFRENGSMLYFDTETKKDP